MLLQGKKNIRAQHLDKKKYSFTGNIKEKKFLRLENFPPPPPHNFSNGPSLKRSEFNVILPYRKCETSSRNSKADKGSARKFQNIIFLPDALKRTEFPVGKEWNIMVKYTLKYFYFDKEKNIEFSFFSLCSVVANKKTGNIWRFYQIIRRLKWK